MAKTYRFYMEIKTETGWEVVEWVHLQACISDLPKDYQGELWIALGIAMNTLANEIEKLED